MAPPSVELESVHITDGQHKVHLEKVLPLRTQEPASKRKTLPQSAAVFLWVCNRNKTALSGFEGGTKQSVLLVFNASLST